MRCRSPKRPNRHVVELAEIIAEMAGYSGIDDVTVRIVGGRLRDIAEDDEFYTVIDGEWHWLDRSVG